MSRAIKTRTKARSHVHDRNYSYFGEFDSRPLIEWLNSPKRPAGDEVEQLLSMNAQLPIHVTEHEVVAYLGRVVRRSKVAVAPVLAGASPDRWQIEWRLVGHLPPSQGLAVIKLLHLAERGLVGRVRKCARSQCTKWFFARFQHQRFHTERCQQETFKGSPEWRAQRAQYMRELRHKEALRERRTRLNRPRRKSK